MAIIPETQYSGKIGPATADYPYGEPRNITTPGDGTGTPWEAALVKDLFGLQQGLLIAANIIPTGSPERVGASQYLDSLSLIHGRVFSSKAAAVAEIDAYGIVANQKYFIVSSDGGSFVGVTGASASTYADDGGSYCGTQFIPTAGDGSTALVRQAFTRPNPLMFGAAGDGTTDDSAAIQLAINYAATDASVTPFESAPVVVIDFLGKQYGMGSPVLFDGLSNVTLTNGSVIAVGGSWTGSDYMFDLTHSGVYGEAINNKIINMNIDAANLTNGIYSENMQRSIFDANNITRFVKYGMRSSDIGVSGLKNGETKITNNVISQSRETDTWIGYQIETQVGVTNGNGIGLSWRSADVMIHNNVIFQCKVCAEFNDFYNAQITGNHFFTGNRTTANGGMAVTNAANNGAGLIRITTGTPHYCETGDVVEIDSIVGTTEANSWWKVTVISATVVDLQNSTFTNAYVSGGVFRPFNYSMVVGADTADVTAGLLFDNNYFDAQPVLFWDSYDHILTSNYSTAGSTVWSKLWIAGTAVSETGGSLIVTNNRFKEYPELIPAEHGSWSATPGIYFAFNKDNDGTLSRLINPSAIGDWVYLNAGLAIDTSGELGFDTDNAHDFGTSTRFIRNTYTKYVRWATGNVFDTTGSGSPEGVLTAGVGSTYRRTDGGAGTTFYVKESGTGNTGWVAK